MREFVTPSARLTENGFDIVSMDEYGNSVDWEPFLEAAGQAVILLRKWWTDRRPGVRTLTFWGSKTDKPKDFSVWGDGSRSVGEGRHDMEKAFRKLGDGLEELLTANQDCLGKAKLSAQAGLSKLANDSSATSNTLIHAAEMCQVALRFTHQGRHEADRIRGGLAEMERLSRAIRAMGRLIGEHIRPAEVVQVLLRIECARLDEVARAPLEALSVEIARVCAKMARTLETEFELVEKSHQTVTHLVDFVRGLDQRQQQSELRRNEISVEMEELRKLGTEQAERDLALARISGGLDRAVGAVIEAMQYQDIVGQRWEHIEAGFAEIEAGEGEEGGIGMNAMVQHAQLIEANSEMESAIGRISESLEAVQFNECQLREDLRSSLADNRRQLMNVRMHALVFEVWDMTRTNQSQLQAVDRYLSPLVEVAGKIGSQIGDVSNEMRLIALNAQVQAARYGAQTGLEVLAESLRGIADQISESGEGLQGDSRAIEKNAIELMEHFCLIGEQAAAVCDECEIDFPPMIEELAKQEDICNQLLRKAHHALENVSSVRAQMEESVRCALVPLENLKEVAIACGDFVEKNYRMNSKVQACLELKLLDKESARYTMAAENDVLLKVAGKSRAHEEADRKSSGELDLF